MARAIFRHSLQQGYAQQRTQVRNLLEAAGFERIGTSSYEADEIPRAAVIQTLRQVFDVLDALPDGVVDHVWIYFDQPDPDAPDPN